MDPVTMALIGSLGGSVIEGGLGYLGQHSANKANRGMAREQMAFQERMSNSAYQRVMQDMRKAGLNPILASKLGGASAPPGAMATAMNELSGFGGATAKAMEARVQRANLENINSQTNLNTANALKSIEEAKVVGYKGQTEKLIGDVAKQGNTMFNSAKKSADLFGGKVGHVLYDLFGKSVPNQMRKGYKRNPVVYDFFDKKDR